MAKSKARFLPPFSPSLCLSPCVTAWCTHRHTHTHTRTHTHTHTGNLVFEDTRTMSVVGRNSLLGKASMPLLLGKTPVVHRSSYNQLSRPGAFRKTRPIGGGGVYNDCPYPYTKAPSAMSPLRVFPTQYKKYLYGCFIVLCYMIGVKFASPNDDWVFFAQYEAARRRRERRERRVCSGYTPLVPRHTHPYTHTHTHRKSTASELMRTTCARNCWQRLTSST